MTPTKIIYPKLSYLLQGACFDLYKELGWGHKEIVYQRGLEIKLLKKNLQVNREVKIPVTVDSQKVGMYVPDMVIEDSIMIELKAKPSLIQADIQQFWHYLRITPYRLGYLINFGKPDGVQLIRRIFDKARN